MRTPVVLSTTLPLCACTPGPRHGSSREDREAAVRDAVGEFHASFDDGFTKPANYATEDWYHINPYGGVDKGRDATVKAVLEVHRTFLKGTTDRIKDIDVRFASGEAAVATLTSEMSPFTSPDGVHHPVESHVRTFAVVKRANRWLIMEDHNTAVVLPGPQ